MARETMAPQAPAPKRKRGRPPHAPTQAADASRGDGDGDERPRKRGKAADPARGAEAPGTEAPPQPQWRRRQPPKTQDGQQQRPLDEPQEPGEAPRSRKTGRRSLQRGRARQDAARERERARREEDEARREQDEPRPRKGGRRDDAGERHRQDASPVRRRQPDRQRRVSPPAAAPAAPPVSPPAAPPSSPPRPYVRVVPQTRRVRQSTIAAKWSPLTGPSLAAVSALLHLAHRPILQRLSTTHQRRAHASAALRLVTRRIARKLARGLPFPPAAVPAPPRRALSADAAREAELDFETVLAAVAALDAQLQPAAHAIELLRREKAAVERDLDRDYDALSRLEAGARAHAREQRGLLGKAHALAPAPQPRQAHDAEAVFTAPAAADEPTASRGLVADLGEELRPLAAQLGGHAESIRSNAQQAEAVVPQLARSRAALRAVLLRHLGQSQYEHVVLG